MAPKSNHSLFAAQLYSEGKTRHEARQAMRSKYPDLSWSRCAQLLTAHWPTEKTTSTENKRKYEPWDPVPLYFFKKDGKDLPDRSLEISQD